MGKSSISIKDISKQAGVSVATVSRVINNKGKYSEETKNRVLKVIEENAYMPNLMAKALRVSHQQAIGVILPEVTNEFFATVSLNIQKSLFDLGYSTIICNTSYSPEYAKRYCAVLKSQNVSGVICVYDRQTNLADYPEDLPIVYIGYDPVPIKRNNFVSVQIDFAQAGWMVTNALIARGCKRIVYMANWLNTREGASSRYLGFERAMRENNLDIDKNLLVGVDTTGSASAYDAITKLIGSGVAFDGVACNSDQAATGVIFALNAHRLKVPQDVKVIGFDNMEISRHFIPAISSVEMRADMQAKHAVDCMMAMLGNKELQQTKFLLSAEVILRETT